MTTSYLTAHQQRWQSHPLTPLEWLTGNAASVVDSLMPHRRHCKNRPRNDL